MIYRGQGLNENSVTGERRGRYRLTFGDRDYLADTLGIRTDLDLRTLGETADMEVDWESTFYPKIPDANPDPNFWCRESHFSDGLSKYGREGDSWTRRVELYLLDCGVTEFEIAAFRAIMLE